MSKKEIAAAVSLALGFAALVAGIALMHIPMAAVVGGALLIALGITLDRAAS